ncbi:MAG: hypothetical protein ACLFUQ_06800 [Candidatus Izemoplasmataceae bacterium]
MKLRDLVLLGGALMILIAIVLMLVSVVSNSTISPIIVSLTMIGGIVLVIIHHSIAVDEN